MNRLKLLFFSITAFIALFTGSVISGYAAIGDIVTYAGGIGDGGPATSARLWNPNNVTVDSTGNIYIAEYYNHSIRKVDTNGIITTVAGNGMSGYSGDGGPATSASLSHPTGVAVDSIGNIYIAEFSSNRIRKVNTNGIITTVAGNGIGGYSGDGGPATSASLFYAHGVAVDSIGNIYIADKYNDRIRKVDTSGIITTVAGNGTSGQLGDGGPATSANLYSPSAVTIDSIGNIYIKSDNRIRKVDTNGIIRTLSGLSDSHPNGVAIDSIGNLYIAGDNRIRKVDTNGIITTVAGNGTWGYSGDGGPATSAGFVSSGVAVDSIGNIYIADGYNNRIRKVDTNGIITTIAGGSTYWGDGGSATSAGINSPSGVVDSTGNIYIADSGNHRIRKVDTAGIITTVAGNGISGYSGDGGQATSASLNYPNGVAVDSIGNIYIADRLNNRIRKVDTNGIITTVAGNSMEGYSGDGGQAIFASLWYPSGVVVDSNFNIYISDMWNHRIRKVDTSGTITTVAGNGIEGYSGDGGPATSASLDHPRGVAVDSIGNIYIADYYNARIRKVSTNGIITTVAGNGTWGYSGDGIPATSASLNTPIGVAVDSTNNIYITDMGNQRIRKVNTSGIIATVAGNGTFGYSGDGGPATSASFNQPSGVAVDSLGNLYIADSGNNRIRKVILANPPATGATLTPDFASPQLLGRVVTFTAGGIGGSGSYEYQFWLNTGSTWAMVQDYSTSNTWTWNTTGLLSGTYGVEVYVKNAGSSASYEASTSINYILYPTGSANTNGYTTYLKEGVYYNVYLIFDLGYQNLSSIPKGYLNFISSRYRRKFVSTSITSLNINGNIADVSGTATMNGIAGYSFTAKITDNGTPGAGLDKIEITYTGPSNFSYSLSGIILSGEFNVKP